jgi:hypothetical protein
VNPSLSTLRARALRRWAWRAGYTEFLRAQTLEPETRIRWILLIGFAFGSFGMLRLAVFAWWLLTGRRVPGWLGERIGHPAAFLADLATGHSSGMPPELRAVLEQRDRKLASI